MNQHQTTLAPPLPKIRTLLLRHLIRLSPNFWERGLGGEGNQVPTSIPAHGCLVENSLINSINGERKTPHPPTPSPHEFAQRLIRMSSAIVRIHEERGSQFFGWSSFSPTSCVGEGTFND
jgi:hypothetical protein